MTPLEMILALIFHAAMLLMLAKYWLARKRP